MRLELFFSALLLACAPAIAGRHEVREEARLSGDPAVRRAAIRHINRLAGLMGFERWVLVVHFDSLPGDVIARMLPKPEYRAAVIMLDLPYFARVPGQVCETSAHELLHIKLLPLRQALLSLIDPADTTMVRQAAMIEESVVTDFARAKVWGCR